MHINCYTNAYLMIPASFCVFSLPNKKLIARFSELNSDSNELKEEVEIVQKRVEENDRLLKVG